MIEAEGDPYLENPDGQTPLQIAIDERMPPEIMELIAAYSPETDEATDEENTITLSRFTKKSKFLSKYFSNQLSAIDF